jgi:hypothetical protein
VSLSSYYKGSGGPVPGKGGGSFRSDLHRGHSTPGIPTRKKLRKKRRRICTGGHGGPPVQILLAGRLFYSRLLPGGDSGSSLILPDQGCRPVFEPASPVGTRRPRSISVLHTQHSGSSRAGVKPVQMTGTISVSPGEVWETIPGKNRCWTSTRSCGRPEPGSPKGADRSG